jgi:hypothetical protein
LVEGLKEMVLSFRLLYIDESRSEIRIPRSDAIVRYRLEKGFERVEQKRKVVKEQRECVLKESEANCQIEDQAGPTYLYGTNKADALTMTSDLRSLGQIKLAYANLDPVFIPQAGYALCYRLSGDKRQIDSWL